MTMADLQTIIKNMKLGKKAGDYYQMTAEDLKFCGAQAHTEILNLINCLPFSGKGNISEGAVFCGGKGGYS